MRSPTSALAARLGIFAALALGAAAAACSRSPAPAASAEPDAGARDADAAKVAVAPAPPTLDASSPRAARDAGPPPSSTARKQLARALEEGRKKSRAKDFAGALAAFDRALEAAPDDTRVLAEIGWAALQAGDLDRAEAAGRRALLLPMDPARRAQVLYNAGRVAEAKNDADGARKMYAESLALRDNAEVKRRLATVGGPLAEGDGACAGAFPSVDALCVCLRARTDILVLDSSGGIACAPSPASLQLGTPRLFVVPWGADPGERIHALVARDGAVVRVVAELGTDYAPGAFGIYNEAEVKGGEVRTIGGREVVVVRSEQRNVDQNAAGLEACIENTDYETVCALGTEARPTRCVRVPVSIEWGCDEGVTVPEEELDDETRALLADLKKGWGISRATLGWTLTEGGAVEVSLQRGEAKGFVASALGRRRLF